MANYNFTTLFFIALQETTCSIGIENHCRGGSNPKPKLGDIGLIIIPLCLLVQNTRYHSESLFQKS